MKKWRDNLYLRALLWMFVAFSAGHIGVLIILSIREKTASFWTLSSLMDLDGFGSFQISGIMSFLVVALAYVLTLVVVKSR